MGACIPSNPHAQGDYQRWRLKDSKAWPPGNGIRADTNSLSIHFGVTILKLSNNLTPHQKDNNGMATKNVKK